MNDIQLKLAQKRISKLAGMSPGRFRANNDLAMFKRDDIGGSGFPQKLSIQAAYSPIRDDQNKYFAQFIQAERPDWANPKAQLQCLFGESLQGS